MGEGLHVVADEGVRMRDRVAYSGLGREVAHPGLDAAVRSGDEFVESGRESLSIPDVRADQAEVRVLLEDPVAALLQAGVVVPVEAVVADHFVAAVEQRLRDVKTDESGAAGEQDPHGCGASGMFLPTPDADETPVFPGLRQRSAS